MADTYLTLSEKSEGLYKEKMSKFISFAIPVQSGSEAKEIVKEYQKEYYDARHVCWAYMVGAARTDFLSNDNGEPSGTAGKPILGQINSFNITNVVIIVVRYFGGIKLGTSGLIVAYKEAAKDAIENANVIELHEEESISFTFPYLAMNDVMKLIKPMNLKIGKQEFNNTCEMTLICRKDYAEDLRSRLSDIEGTSIIDEEEEEGNDL